MYGVGCFLFVWCLCRCVIENKYVIGISLLNSGNIVVVVCVCVPDCANHAVSQPRSVP